MPAVIAIIGRPNVGKSTLSNRILGKRIALESPISGTTRDPVTAFYEGAELHLLFVDTGGLEFGKIPGKIEADVQTQARLAITSADLILFCVDMRQQMTTGEQEVASLLRKKAGKTPVLLIGTKAEGKDRILEENDLYSLGVSAYEPMFVAALQGIGISDVLETVEKILRERGFQKEEPLPDVAANIVVLGRPNVGKSSLINALSNSEKLIVSEIAGTTRDAVDLEIKREGKTFRCIDTAGIRRRSKREEGIENFSILRSLASLRRADVTVLVIDAKEGITHQEKHILEHIMEAKTGLILVVNKVDLLEKGMEARTEFLRKLQIEIPFVSWAPVVFISALERKNIHKIFPLSEQIVAERQKRISTANLNIFLQEIQQLQPLSGVRNTRPRIKYGTQISVNPPHFLFHGNRVEAIHFSSRRYLENRLRDAFGFVGTPLTIEMAMSKNPYHGARKIRLPADAKKEQRKNSLSRKKSRL